MLGKWLTEQRTALIEEAHQVQTEFHAEFSKAQRRGHGFRYNVTIRQRREGSAPEMRWFKTTTRRTRGRTAIHSPLKRPPGETGYDVALFLNAGATERIAIEKAETAFELIRRKIGILTKISRRFQAYGTVKPRPRKIGRTEKPSNRTDEIQEEGGA